MLYSEPCATLVEQSPSTLTAVAEKSDTDERFHYPLEWEIEINCAPLKNSYGDSSGKIKCYKKANFNSINEFWENFDVTKFSSAPSMNEATKLFYDSMELCINDHVPSITPKVFSTNHPPWFDRELINLNNRRDKARKRIKMRGNTREYDQINNEFIDKHNQRVSEYQKEQDEMCKANPKKFWTQINSHRKNNGYPDHFEYDGRNANNDNEAAQLFNEFFSTVFVHDDPNFNIDSFLNECSTNDDPIEPITVEETLKELQSIDITKGVGLDGLHPILLKNCAHSLAPIICTLFNKSIETGCVPKVWKQMKIIPIHKSGKRTTIEQYRPIAIPPCIAKIQDKLMTNRLSASLAGKISIAQHEHQCIRNDSTGI